MKVLVTIQEPDKPRLRYIVYARTTFEAVSISMPLSVDANVYISAKPASLEDEAKYTEFSAVPK